MNFRSTARSYRTAFGTTIIINENWCSFFIRGIRSRVPWLAVVLEKGTSPGKKLGNRHPTLRGAVPYTALGAGRAIKTVPVAT